MEAQETTRYQNPMDYLKIFFRRKWLFIAPLFAGLVLSISACFIIPPSYESYTLILVEEEKIINPLIQGLAVSTSAAQRMLTIREQLLGWNSLVGLTKRLNLAKNVQNQAQYENLILTLRRDINVQMRQANIIRIAYFGKEPEETRLVTKTLTDILVDENMRSQTKETDVAITFIKEQLEVYKRKIKETEVANLEEQLKTLLADSTEQHPLVKELRGKIAIAKKELESGEYKIPNTPISGDNPTYQVLKKELDKITNPESAMGSMAYASAAGESNDPNNAIYKLMLMDKVDSAMARDKNVNEMIYNMLLQKLETAKITQRLEASKEGTRYTVIDPPRLPLNAARPNKFKVILLGMFLGGCAGTGMVFGREFLDQSFLDIDDAKQTLEFPVLGGISRITTLEEIEKEKYQKKRLITISIASSCVLIIISMLYYLFRK
jgi:uncharacterized protein involved in exopolysaccharide biosynthesis